METERLSAPYGDCVNSPDQVEHYYGPEHSYSKQVWMESTQSRVTEGLKEVTVTLKSQKLAGLTEYA